MAAENLKTLNLSAQNITTHEKAFFQNIYGYQHHFNQQLIEQLVLHYQALPERCIPLFIHVLNAQKIWNARILGLPSSGVFDVHPLETMQALALLNHQHTMEIS